MICLFYFVTSLSVSVLARNVTKCELLRDGVLTDEERSGGFIFNCDKNGAFVNLQCNVDIGKCWCVNSKDGFTVDGTITEAGAAPPICTTESMFHVLTHISLFFFFYLYS